MSNNTIDDYSDILDKKAKSIAIDKLRSSGIDYKEMPEDEFLELVENRKDILVGMQKDLWWWVAQLRH